MFTHDHITGQVTRDFDGVVVQPVTDQSAFEMYAIFLQNGGIPNQTGVTVPQSVTPRQIRLALNQIGKRDDVELMVAAGSRDLRDEWQYSAMFERSNPELIALGEALGTDLDALFILAATL
jgi:hypothetical protein